MTYSLQDRLRYNSRNMARVNTEDATYIAGGKERQVKVSPILISPDELTPGNVSDTRVERQDFAIYLDGDGGLKDLYPPAIGHKIRRPNGDEFILSSMGTDEPP